MSDKDVFLTEAGLSFDSSRRYAILSGVTDGHVNVVRRVDEQVWQRFAASLRLATEIRLDFRYRHEFDVRDVCERCGTTRLAVVAAMLRRLPFPAHAIGLAIESGYRSAVEQRRIAWRR